MRTSLTDRWQSQLATRCIQGTLRTLPTAAPVGIDFASNDYLGFAREPLPKDFFQGPLFSGATGSRLLTGNRENTQQLETQWAIYLQAETALLFTSGYGLNSGIFSAICQPEDIIFIDEAAHASLKAGCRLSRACLYYFRHNDVSHLKTKLLRLQATRKSNQSIVIVVESLYSMDGDLAPLQELVTLAETFDAHVVVDEAHALGTLGSGLGVSVDTGVASRCLARIYAFGKALGCQGAVVVGSTLLRDMIINFCPSFLYTTALSPILQEVIGFRLRQMQRESHRRTELHATMAYAKATTPIVNFHSQSRISVRTLAQHIQKKGFWVLPIVSPTVKRGTERIRICLHATHTQVQIDDLWNILHST